MSKNSIIVHTVHTRLKFLLYHNKQKHVMWCLLSLWFNCIKTQTLHFILLLPSVFLLSEWFLTPIVLLFPLVLINYPSVIRSLFAEVGPQCDDLDASENKWIVTQLFRVCRETKSIFTAGLFEFYHNYDYYIWYIIIINMNASEPILMQERPGAFC